MEKLLAACKDLQILSFNKWMYQPTEEPWKKILPRQSIQTEIGLENALIFLESLRIQFK